MKTRILPKKKKQAGPSVGKPLEQIGYSVGGSPLGMVLVATSGKGVVSILIGSNPAELVRDLELRFPRAVLVDGSRETEARLKQVLKHIAKPKSELDLPLDIRGTDFQRRVWQAIRKVPAGQTTTYTEVAKKVGAPRAMRAVGNTCSKNNLALAIPCHRVLRSDGSPRQGFHWGTTRQAELLRREGAK
jgi:AraC family transcriptional regulator of adaptative response/methylated-DNA-[protein]-cysteine methyltransferase